MKEDALRGWEPWASSAGEWVGSQRRFIQALETRGSATLEKKLVEVSRGSSPPRIRSEFAQRRVIYSLRLPFERPVSPLFSFLHNRRIARAGRR